MKQFQRTGIYMRLSRDDEKAGESTSIEHQRVILRNYVAERGGTVTEEYIDDGWSGTNFDRPAVKRLLEDAKNGKIDTIAVKDLSRFGRNYIQVGQYIDYIFPAYGIRFVALGDNVDTADRNSAAMDMMPIMNVFNEWHAANTSKKIRAVLEASQRAGKYTNWNYPYGYKAGADENRTAVIDKDAATVVRRIFELRAQGNSSRMISRTLTDEGIPNPAAYFTRLDGNKLNKSFSSYWSPKTVMWILENPTYLGKTVQHKTTCVSYKNHKVIKISPSERIVKENAHEAVIPLELWDRVQAVNRSVSRGKTDKTNKVHALSGLLVCPDCGKKLKIKTLNRSSGKCSFVCRTYADLGKRYCTSHSIAEKEIESVVLHDIRAMLPAVTFDEEKARKSFIENKAKTRGDNGYSDERQLEAYNSRLAEIDKLIQAAFEEKVIGGLPESVCTALYEKYRKERAAVEEKISETKKRLAKDNQAEEDVDGYIKKLKSYLRCEALTRELCLQLINFITVGEKDGVDGGREIRIYYNLTER